MSKKTTVSGILLVLLVLATTPLLGTDNVSFLKWWLMTLVLGIGFYPAAAALFPRFHDRGWMFSKVLGIVVSGFAVFALGSFGLVPFTPPVCLITVGVLILASWIFGCFSRCQFFICELIGCDIDTPDQKCFIRDTLIQVKDCLHDR